MNPLPHPRSLACAALLTFLALTCGHSQTVPALVNYQGRLANPDGSPLPTADYTLTFNIYDATTNGTLVWGPQVFDGAVAQGHGARIPVVQGYFNVMLGPVDAAGAPRPLADAFNGATRYVEIAVSNRPPILPRQQILTTPFAFQAANSAKLAGYDWSALLGTNNPAAGTIPFSKLAQRQVGTNVGVGGVAISAEAGQDTTSQTYVDVTSLVVTLRTTGRPVEVGLIVSAGSESSESYIGALVASPARLNVILLRNGTALTRSVYFSSGGPATIPPGGFRTIDQPPAGTNTYSIQMRVEPSAAPGVISRITGVRLVAFEL